MLGSRTFNNYNLLSEILNLYFNINELIIISGGAKGADSLAEKFATDNNLKFLLFPANWDKHGKAAGYIRNKEMVLACDQAIVFWDGQSKGTKHTIDLMNKENKYCIIVDTSLKKIYNSN